MKVISTIQSPEQSSSIFYICKDKDVSTVLFDTMGGYRFVSLSERDREWQSPLSFSTFELAELKLKELHDENKEITLNYKLQIVKVTHTESTKHEFYQTYRTDGQHRDANQINLFAPFEKFYSGHSTGYTESKLIQLRTTEHDIGYLNPTINEAFKRYVALVDSLPTP